MNCKTWKLFFTFVILISIPSIGWTDEKDLNAFFKPLPNTADNPTNPLNPAKVELGKMLYFDPRLSKSGFISCNSCHNLATGGTDNLSTSIGHKWQIGSRNAPTVFNAAFNIAQFWDGREKDLEGQAKGPILNPKEMAATEKLVLERIRSIPVYSEQFKKAFPGEKEPLNYDNVARAIAAFERTLITPSRFDDFINGNGKALTPDEKHGLSLFIEKGCVTCHNGAGVGGSMFDKFDYGEDLGRYEVTKKEEDKRSFRVASLRNVVLTYPYFHDGKVWSLKEAVKIMGEKQLGIKLTDEEISSIVVFLNSLTGRQLKVDIPFLPASSDATPTPDVK